MDEATIRELYEIARAIDGEAAVSSRSGQLYSLEAIATRIRQLADKVPVFVSPGAVYCVDCDWASVGGAPVEQMTALRVHHSKEHK